MSAAQNNRCAICLRDKVRLGVDHDHSTGRVRGLLCHKCNAAIGLLEDSRFRLKSALKYLAGAPYDY